MDTQIPKAILRKKNGTGRIRLHDLRLYTLDSYSYLKCMVWHKKKRLKIKLKKMKQD